MQPIRASWERVEEPPDAARSSTHPRHDALHQQAGAERQPARPVSLEELLHVLQPLAEDALRGGCGTGG